MSSILLRCRVDIFLDGNFTIRVVFIGRVDKLLKMYYYDFFRFVVPDSATITVTVHVYGNTSPRVVQSGMPTFFK